MRLSTDAQPGHSVFDQGGCACVSAAANRHLTAMRLSFNTKVEVVRLWLHSFIAVYDGIAPSLCSMHRTALRQSSPTGALTVAH